MTKTLDGNTEVSISFVAPRERPLSDGGIIGRIAAGTTVTPAMIAMMMSDHLRGEPPAFYMDGSQGSAFTKGHHQR